MKDIWWESGRYASKLAAALAIASVGAGMVSALAAKQPDTQLFVMAAAAVASVFAAVVRVVISHAEVRQKQRNGHNGQAPASRLAH